jgi:N-acyl-D-amino-acid deacylase
MFDLIIRNAEVADGLGSPLRHADVAVKDGRIAAIGRDLGLARETVDAKGLVLAPGVIDVHTHYDA